MSEKALPNWSDLTREKREILAYLLGKEGIELDQTTIIPRQSRVGAHPLSYAQQRLWFLEQYEPDLPLYNIPLGIHISGLLNLNALKQSITDVVDRHEILRTTYHLQDGEPFQIIAPSLEVKLPVNDLRHLNKPEKELEFQKLKRTEVHQPFDLMEGPVIRTGLYHLEEHHHFLLLIIHHIAFDGWSGNIFLRELALFYDGHVTGQSVDLRVPAVQYVDYSSWQRNWLQKDVLQQQLIYWQEQLKDTHPLFNFPTSKPRPSVQTYNGAHFMFSIPENMSQALKDLGRQEGVTLFISLLTIYKILLHRYTGFADISVGTPVANRNLPDLEDIIGFFVNTLVLRTRFSSPLSFRDFLQQVREVCLHAYQNQDYPFERLVEKLKPERNVTHPPFFQTMFTLVVRSAAAFECSQVTFQLEEIHTNTAKFDLMLFIRETASGLKGRITYNTDLFEEDTIERMAHHYLTLLESVISAPDSCITALPLLTKREEHQLLVEWNNTPRAYPSDRCINELFEAQAALSPEVRAVIQGDEALTYFELNQSANQLAYFLRKRGLTAKQPVAVCLDRSLEVAIALLATLKAGGAYLPLDPNYPAKRVEFILRDTQTRIILTHLKLVPQFQDLPVEVIPVVRDKDYYEEPGSQNPENVVRPQDPAYVMFTSGSSGTPKGVAVSHRAVINLMFGTDDIKYEKNCAILHLAPLSFDASTFEIWGPLLHGGTCILYPDQQINLSVLGHTLDRFDIDVLFLTTALFNTIINESPEILNKVKQLLIGGEAISVRHVLRANAALPSTRIINCYGPTENTTFTTTYSIPHNLPASTTSIPIGRPLSNSQLYILDAHQQPVPIGVPGELCLAGDGLSSGYLNRPELTQEKFVNNIFSVNDGDKMYKTGDLVRYLPDGTLEFLGRLDDQIKLRGFRIEPGEIVNALQEHNLVKAAFVQAVRDKHSNKRLVAYIISTNQEEPTGNELKEFLKQKLPEFMIPSFFFYLDTFPLTAHGKIDIRALPEPDYDNATRKRVFVQPRDQVEKKLAQIWCNLLHIEAVSLEDNFFERGGYSLLAIKLFSQIEKYFGKKLQVSVLFQAPTVRKIAALIKAESEAVPVTPVIPIQPEGSNPPLFLMHHADGGVLDYRELANLIDQKTPVYGIQALDLEGVPLTYGRIKEAAAAYADAIRATAPDKPYFIAGHSFGGLIALETARQLSRQNEQIGLLIIIECSAPGIRFLPGKDIARYLLWTYWERIKFHFGRLKTLQGQNRWTYLFMKLKSIQNKWTTYLIRFQKKQKHLDSKAQIFLKANVEMVRILSDSDLIREGYLGKITLFKASVSLPIYDNHDYGWGKYASLGVEVHEIQGEHGNLIKEPYVFELAEKMNACIKQVL
ncbi:amino acid adenylation domain-containing protein [candidate division CSSED10-310 bacterium]|uniref:Amino acid adenylation domain-containing protein n=1 Tax=candidate division CSSED10-310 bacterium TaxID=2855610 RepID=A0ABV6Z0J2_UNCC1